MGTMNKATTDNIRTLIVDSILKWNAMSLAKAIRTSCDPGHREVVPDGTLVTMDGSGDVDSVAPERMRMV
jgi:hypothetical protein